MPVPVKNKDIEAVKAYLHYIAHLNKQKQKNLLKAFLRQYVQDVRFDPFISVEALELLKKNNISSETVKNITWDYEKPGEGVPEEIRHLFVFRGKNVPHGNKILHFEHNIPAGQAAELLLRLNLTAEDVDNKIKEILASCTLCLITASEDKALTNKKDDETNKSWRNWRPFEAYNILEPKIELMTREKACSQLSK